MTSSPHPDGFEAHGLLVGGQRRSYLLSRPPQTAGEPLPLVLAFHGSGINALQMSKFCGLHEPASAAGFAVVYPNGTGRTEAALNWNAGNCCGWAMREQIDDVGFVAAMLDDLQERLPLDPTRVFATGMSNGAMLTYRLAAELADRIAAVAPVGGPMGLDACQPSRPVSVCHFHGTHDDFTPYAGGLGKKSVSKCVFHSVERTIDCWVRANECTTPPQVEVLPKGIEDGTQVTRLAYRGGREGSAVVLYSIAGGGHTWPGRATPFSILGRSTRNIDANAVMLDFFQRHPRTPGA